MIDSIEEVFRGMGQLYLAIDLAEEADEDAGAEQSQAKLTALPRYYPILLNLCQHLDPASITVLSRACKALPTVY